MGASGEGASWQNQLMGFRAHTVQGDQEPNQIPSLVRYQGCSVLVELNSQDYFAKLDILRK